MFSSSDNCSSSNFSNKSEEEATLKEHTVLNLLKEIIPFSYCSSITFEKKKEIELKPFSSCSSNDKVLEDMDTYLTSTGFYYPEEEEEEWKFIGEVFKEIL
ncbi:hypothetical protein ABK040_007426 [Willaertia magna]